MLRAADTFRAAAIDQLKIWVNGGSCWPAGARRDAAGLAYDALVEANGEEIDVLLVDTAAACRTKRRHGRARKDGAGDEEARPSAPHAVLLVLDATVGQNALSQVGEFQRTAGVTGLVMTELDGTARGGILVAVAATNSVHSIGVGEGIDDLAPFAAKDFRQRNRGD